MVHCTVCRKAVNGKKSSILPDLLTSWVVGVDTSRMGRHESRGFDTSHVGLHESCGFDTSRVCWHESRGMTRVAWADTSRVG